MPPKVPEIQAVYNQSAFWTQAAAALATKFCPKIAFQFHIKKQQNKVTILIWTEQSTHPHCEMIWNSNAACFWSKKHVFGYIKCINNTKTAASPMENKSQISHVGHNWHARLKHLHAKDLFSRKGANAARLGYGSGLVSFLHKGLRGRALFEWLKHSDPPTHLLRETSEITEWMLWPEIAKAEREIAQLHPVLIRRASNINVLRFEPCDVWHGLHMSVTLLICACHPMTAKTQTKTLQSVLCQKGSHEIQLNMVFMSVSEMAMQHSSRFVRVILAHVSRLHKFPHSSFASWGVAHFATILNFTFPTQVSELMSDSAYLRVKKNCKAATENTLTFLLNRRASTFTWYSCGMNANGKSVQWLLDFVRVILVQVAMQPCEYNWDFFALLLGAREFQLGAPFQEIFTASACFQTRSFP